MKDIKEEVAFEKKYGSTGHSDSNIHCPDYRYPALDESPLWRGSNSFGDHSCHFSPNQSIQVLSTLRPSQDFNQKKRREPKELNSFFQAKLTISDFHHQISNLLCSFGRKLNSQEGQRISILTYLRGVCYIIKMWRKNENAAYNPSGRDCPFEED